VAGIKTTRAPITQIQRSRFMKSSSLELRDCPNVLTPQQEATLA
jgi:hypothetical protein